jgi:hypothetical protein
MDKTIVGNNAGKVWCALKEIGEISIPELARRLNLSVESTALAAGWLARENKICIQRKNGLIALSDESTFPFSFGYFQILRVSIFGLVSKKMSI